MKLLVGLGNPGTSYAHHRHNVGFMALDRIAERHQLGPWKRRFHGSVCDSAISGRRVLLLKPLTYMNDSGRSVGEAQRFLKVAESDIFVFHDELDLAPGKVRVKRGGGNAGHNGLRSITAHVGNDYGRVRIGIGHPGVKELVHAYVLHDFAKADAAWLEALLDAVADATPRLVQGDEARFLTDVARRVREADAIEKRAASGVELKPLAQRPHPAGERQLKRATALADSLKKWLKGRKQEN
jgi:PTH1 family peptidyl-tRNA hydrolase